MCHVHTRHSAAFLHESPIGEYPASGSSSSAPWALLYGDGCPSTPAGAGEIGAADSSSWLPKVAAYVSASLPRCRANFDRPVRRQLQSGVHPLTANATTTAPPASFRVGANWAAAFHSPCAIAARARDGKGQERGRDGRDAPVKRACPAWSDLYLSAQPVHRRPTLQTYRDSKGHSRTSDAPRPKGQGGVSPAKSFLERAQCGPHRSDLAHPRRRGNRERLRR